MNILNLNAVPSKMFFGEEGIGLARYDNPRYPDLQRLNKQMRSKIWEPETVPMSQERRSFHSMTDAEKFVFTANIQRPTILDTIQGRAPVHVFGKVCTDPTVENCITTWQFFESIHSESYTHIERAIWPDPSEIINAIPSIDQLVRCTKSISEAYDRMITNPNKENLYLALVSANALEGLRFQITFMFMFNFKEREQVAGSGDIFKYIARDENFHMVFTERVIRALPKDDPEFVQIIGDNRARAIEIFDAAHAEELEWAEYSLSRGPVLGMNLDSAKKHLDYLRNRQLRKLGLSSSTAIPAPLHFLSKYIDDDKRNAVQVAPQEDGTTTYVSATALNMDLDSFDVAL